MATTDRVPEALQEIGAFVADMGESFDAHAMSYAVAYYHAQLNGRLSPPAPPMHGYMAKAVREVVNDVLAMDRRPRRRS